MVIQLWREYCPFAKIRNSAFDVVFRIFFYFLPYVMGGLSSICQLKGLTGRQILRNKCGFWGIDLPKYMKIFCVPLLDIVVQNLGCGCSNACECRCFCGILDLYCCHSLLIYFYNAVMRPIFLTMLDIELSTLGFLGIYFQMSIVVYVPLCVLFMQTLL